MQANSVCCRQTRARRGDANDQHTGVLMRPQRREPQGKALRCALDGNEEKKISWDNSGRCQATTQASSKRAPILCDSLFLYHSGPHRGQCQGAPVNCQAQGGGESATNRPAIAVSDCSCRPFRQGRPLSLEVSCMNGVLCTQPIDGLRLNKQC